MLLHCTKCSVNSSGMMAPFVCCVRKGLDMRSTTFERLNALWCMLQVTWYVKHYERAYLGEPLSVTLYPIAPFPNKHIYWEREKRRGNNFLHFWTWIIFPSSFNMEPRVVTQAAYKYWLHDRLNNENPKEKYFLDSHTNYLMIFVYFV